MMSLQGLFFDGKNAFQVPITSKENIDWEIQQRKPKWAIIVEVETGNVFRQYKAP